ncbi:stage II sporulation protein R [Filobacillus milosensis]|uniref:Stage II sporulation protein R n=1 Tax=Filobacillus milosensis TaxID=94137 RepID=A0A4Y8IFN9_9BACI|nr:stage II sporulation protein R [Filobacillus milosensis]TFB19241.1 stage II sporulation protein R [Filobacillus milosensis]
MRYVLISLALIIGVQFFYSQAVAEPKPQQGYQVIPDEAIRLRILANSNSDKDQELKREVRDRVNAEITKWVEDLTSIEEARKIINNNMDQIEDIVAETVGDQDFTVNYGEVEFPDKIYDRYVYPAGTYEAILITIGEGMGDNWWCVLFPPLCFVDFSNGATVLDHENAEPALADETEEDVEVKFFLWEWIKNVFKA